MSNSPINGAKISFGQVFLPDAWRGHEWTPGQYREAIESLKARVVELDTKAIRFAPVVQRTVDEVTLSIGGGQFIRRKVGKWAEQAKPGMLAVIDADEMRVVGFEESPPGAGFIVVVEAVHADTIEFTSNSSRHVAARGFQPVNVGDRVVIDPGCSVVLKNIGSSITATPPTDTGVSWDDIGGLEDAKRLLREAIEEPVKKAAVYKRFGRKPTKGIALAGPGGVGKTMLAKAAATALAGLHGSRWSESAWISIKGPEILGKFVGQSEEAVRSLFKRARDHFKAHGYPAIIFIDEADGLLGKRGRAQGLEGMERTLVPQFLAEMDGMEASGALVIIATNRPDDLDPAIMRDGRIDRRINIDRPGQQQCEVIFQRHFRDCPTDGDLAAVAASELFNRDHTLYRIQTKSDGDHWFRLSDLASGAMCAGIVQRATQLAIRRDAESVVGDDVVEAVRETLREQVAVSHEDDIARFVKSGWAIEKIERMRK